MMPTRQELLAFIASEKQWSFNKDKTDEQLTETFVTRCVESYKRYTSRSVSAEQIRAAIAPMNVQVAMLKLAALKAENCAWWSFAWLNVQAEYVKQGKGTPETFKQEMAILTQDVITS